jgi:hypothetical protein
MGFGNNAVVTVEGGAINATGRFGVNAATNNLTYVQTGGVITVCTIGNASSTLASFDLGQGVGPDVVMSGGTIIVRINSTGAPARDYRNQQGNTAAGISNTVLQFGDAGSGVAKTFNVEGLLPNVVVSNASAGHTVLYRPATIFNNSARNVTINAGCTYNIGNQAYLQRGTTVTNDGTLAANGPSSRFIWFEAGGNCTYQGGGTSTGVLTSWETQAANLTMSQGSQLVVRRAIIFIGNILNSNKLTVGDNSATPNPVQIGNTTTPTAAGGFDVAPTFDLGTGGQQLFYLRTMASRVTGPEVNPGRALVNLAYDDNVVARTLTIAGGDIAVSGTTALTNGRVITNANTLAVNGAVTRTTGYVDGLLRKPVSVGGPVSRTFEVGDALAYSPVDVTFANVTGAGALTGQATGGDHAQIGSSALDPGKTVNRHWTLTNSGTTFTTADAVFNFVPGDIDGGANFNDFVVRKYDAPNWSATTTGTRTATSTQATGITSFSDFAVGELLTYTIVASAGSGGSITPSGSVVVPQGNNQSFTITPGLGLTIADVLVDGNSVGAVSSYTFTNVVANHTIAATFAGNNVSPANPSACITPAQACQTVPVNISRADATPMRLFHVEFQLSPELQLCGTPSASVTEGTYLSSFNSNTTFFVVNNGGGSYSADGTINGVPCGQAAATGNLFNIAVTHTGSGGTGTVTVSAVTLRDCSNNEILPVSIGPAASVTIDLIPVTVAAIADPQTVEEQSTLTVTPSATQSACASGTLAWTVTPSLPLGASFNPGTGQIIWTPGCGLAGNYGPFTLTATAPSGDYGTSNAFGIQVTHKAGTVSVAAISTPQVVAEGSPLVITPSATTTPCVAGPLTWAVAPALPAGATFSTSTGEIQWTPGCSQAGNYGPFTLTATAATSELGSSNAFSINVTDVPVAIAAPTGVSAAQVLTGNPAGQTTGITVNFTPPGGATAILVYRAPFGNYPEYDDAGGATPAQPTTWPPAAPWTLTSVTTSGGVDSPGTRDFWYYVAYAQNACDDYSLASTMTGGTLDYHLGDVTDGMTPGTGDNLVQSEDISALGAYYGMNLNPSDPFNYLDVGPTTTNFVNGRPTTDNKVNFEDLVMFAINYSVVSQPNLLAAAKPVGASRVAAEVDGPAVAGGNPAGGTSQVAALMDRLILHASGTVTLGQTVEVPVTMEGTGSVQAMSIQLGWDPTVVRPVGQQAGAWLSALGGLALSAKPGTVDVAALGQGQGLAGTGEIAVFTFEVIGAGNPAIRIETVDARDQQNRVIPVNTSGELPTPELPKEMALQMTSGNPSRQSVTFAVSLSERSNVDLSIYGVDGRRVAVLMSGVREPGVTQATWDGRDVNGRPMPSGVFYARLTAGTQVFKRTISYLR